MKAGAKKFLIWLFAACLVVTVLCTVYYINHPGEAENGIIETMNQIDEA